MSETLSRVIALVERREIRISDHGYDQLSEDGIRVRDLVEGISHAEIVEDYADYPKGPCVLVLQQDAGGAVHAVWGIPKGESSPAVLVTAYRPDPDRWTNDFLRRQR